MENLHILPTDKPSRLCINGKNQMHIYITSDEEIKQGGYGLSKLNEIIKFHSGYDYRYYAKIILTTDPDLIADGVQSIDDEFLEWFVNNPSCEEIKVESYSYMDKNISESEIFTDYTIIIPQEESKQETLEEVRKYAELSYYGDEVDVFVNGAKWQAERMYSEEEVKELLIQRCSKHFSTYDKPLYKLLLREDLEWFEQFKKK
jgi:hypothetical protein